MTEMGLVFANRTQTATQYSKSTYGHKYAHPCNWQNAQYVAFYRWSWRLKGRKSTSRSAKCSNIISVQLTCYTIDNILLTDTYSVFSPKFLHTSRTICSTRPPSVHQVTNRECIAQYSLLQTNASTFTTSVHCANGYLSNNFAKPYIRWFRYANRRLWSG